MKFWAAFLLTLTTAPSLAAADFRAGVARVDLTPQQPIWLSGYASRTKPSDGVHASLWAKALAVADEKDSRAVIVTTDVIGLPRSISDEVGARVEKEFGLERSRLLLNSSHTHTGPVIRANLSIMYNLDDQQDRVVKEYGRRLVDQLVTVVGASLKDLAPARIEYGAGDVGFAVNRREFTDRGVRIGVNPRGLVDHSVPVLKITGPDGSTRVLLFGYACHNTSLTGEFYQISGDYAGAAQREVEKAQPETTAMFLMLCGADQNPHPRTKLEHVEQHGKALAAEVIRVASGKLEPVRGRVRTAFRVTELPLALHTRETFEKLSTDTNIYRRRLAEEMLKQYDARRPARRVLYPLQAIRLGDEHAILALGGEVAVGYALRAKREYPKLKLIVAGYSNDVMAYIPTEQILKEGGYEALDSMTYYGHPAPFAPGVENEVFANIRRVMQRVGF